MRERRRETCICVTPMSSAISRWVRPFEEAELQDVAVPLAESPYDGGQGDPRLGGGLPAVLDPDELPERGAPSSSPTGRSSEVGVKQP